MMISERTNAFSRVCEQKEQILYFIAESESRPYAVLYHF